MKIIHTSDWHLGRTVYGRRCQKEFSAFLEWLIEEVNRHQVDYLLIAGDVFDSSSPSAATQKLYFSFLHRASKSSCRHVIIIAGNHDSPTLLQAPKLLLEQINVTVIGKISENVEDEIITLKDREGIPELIVCAVPFLRDSDIRYSEPGESFSLKAEKLVSGIADHYRKVAEKAVSLQQHNYGIPIIGMGHLFTAGGKTDHNREVRDLYVGSLSHIHTSLLPKEFNYLALGHLHLPQFVDSSKCIRYSGSPLLLSFDSKKNNRSITLIDSDDFSAEPIQVPPFLNLQTIQGDLATVSKVLDSLVASKEKVLLEILLTEKPHSETIKDLENKVKNSDIEILRIMRDTRTHLLNHEDSEDHALEDLSVLEVFHKYLIENGLEDDTMDLDHCFLEIVNQIEEGNENSPQ